MKDESLFDLLKEFIINALPIVKNAIEQQYFKPKYDKYPTLKYRENGMPDIGEYGFNAPVRIDDLFNIYMGKRDIEINTIKGYVDLSNYLIAHEKFKDFYYPVEDAKRDVEFLDSSVQIFILNLLERYYLLSTSEDIDYKLLEDIYLPVENNIFSDEPHFDIAVPILFVNFDFDEYKINDNVIIRRIRDEYHKSRISIVSYSPPITSALISSASHELVLQNYYSKRTDNFFNSYFSDESIYPHENIEYLFNSLKIISNINTGYAQVLVYPHNWVRRYNIDLPYLTGTSVKRYPNFYDNYYWTSTNLPKISIDEIKQIGELYIKLSVNRDNKIKIASKRLRYSYLRDNDEDSILDIIIALETLLSDSEKGEITHKLSLRISKLLSDFDKKYDPINVFDSVKKIYAFRSKIVHGSSKVVTQKEIRIPNNPEPIKIVLLANDYLRDVIKILLFHPEFLDSKKIDELLLR